MENQLNKLLIFFATIPLLFLLHHSINFEKTVRKNNPSKDEFFLMRDLKKLFGAVVYEQYQGNAKINKDHKNFKKVADLCLERIIVLHRLP